MHPSASSTRRPVRTLALTLCAAGAALVTGGLRTDGPTARATEDPGTIVQTGSTIEVGTSTIQGIVLIDSCAAPEVPPTVPLPGALGAIGTMPGSLPAFGGEGAGSGSFQSSGALQQLEGGTYEFTSYTVSAGHTVRYTGAVTILCTGPVVIEGVLETSSLSAAPLTIRSAETITITRQGNQPCSFGPSANGGGTVVLDAVGAIRIGGTQPNSFRAATGVTTTSVTITSQDDTDGVVLNGANVGGGLGAVTIETPRFSATQASVAAGASPLVVRSRSAGAVLTDAILNGSTATLQAAGALNLTGSGVQATGGNLTVAAYGGDLRASNSSLTTSGAGAAADLRASGSIVVENEADVANSNGATLDVTAFGGDVQVENLDAVSSGNINGTGASVVTTIRASRDVLVYGDADVSGESGLTIEAGRNIDARGAFLLRAGTTGTLRLRAGGTLTVGTRPGAGSHELVCGTLDAAASGNGASAFAVPFFFPRGPATIHTADDLTVGGTLQARGKLSVLSRDGDIRLNGATLETDTITETSPDIEICTWGGSDTTIDLTDATVRTGSAAQASGNVDILIRDQPAPPPEYVGSLLPVKVGVKEDEDGNATLKVNGTIDLGETGAAPTTLVLTVGSVTERFSLTPKGRKLRGSTANGTVTVTPPKRGGSKYTFKLLLRAQSAEVLSGSTITFSAGNLETEGSPVVVYGESEIEIENGKFKVGKTGTLRPAGGGLWLLKSAVKLTDGDDTVKTTFVVAEGSLTFDPRDVTITVGTAVFTAPAASFVQKGSKLVSTQSDGTTITLDPAGGTIVLSGRDAVDVTGGGDVVIEVTIVIGSGSPLVLRSRFGNSGKRLSY